MHGSFGRGALHTTTCSLTRRHQRRELDTTGLQMNGGGIVGFDARQYGERLQLFNRDGGGPGGSRRLFAVDEAMMPDVGVLAARTAGAQMMGSVRRSTKPCTGTIRKFTMAA